MIKLDVEHELNNTYLVVNMNEGETGEDYRHAMMRENCIPGLLVPYVRLINNEQQIFYDISQLQCFRDKYQLMDMNREEVRNLFESIHHISEVTKEYLIEEGNILLDPKHIFWNYREKAFRFICIPSPNPHRQREEGLKALLLFMMQHIDNADDKLVSAIYEAYAFAETGNMGFCSLYMIFSEKIKEEQKADEQQSAVKNMDIIPPEEPYSNTKTSFDKMYIPSPKEWIALLLVISGLGLIGYDVYLRMLT